MYEPSEIIYRVSIAGGANQIMSRDEIREMNEPFRSELLELADQLSIADGHIGIRGNGYAIEILDGQEVLDLGLIPPVVNERGF